MVLFVTGILKNIKNNLIYKKLHLIKKTFTIIFQVYCSYQDNMDLLLITRYAVIKVKIIKKYNLN